MRTISKRKLAILKRMIRTRGEVATSRLVGLSSDTLWRLIEGKPVSPGLPELLASAIDGMPSGAEAVPSKSTDRENR